MKNPVSAPGPPPFKNPGSAPADSDGKQCKQSTLVRKERHNRMSGFFANGGPKPGRGQSQLAEIAAFKT